MDYKILQIIPADGWHVVYSFDNGEEFRAPVLCFALIEFEENGKIYQNIEPMDFDDGLRVIERVCDVSNFVRLEHEGDTPPAGLSPTAGGDRAQLT